jgi:hypothetical protein
MIDGSPWECIPKISRVGFGNNIGEMWLMSPLQKYGRKA